MVQAGTEQNERPQD